MSRRSAFSSGSSRRRTAALCALAALGLAASGARASNGLGFTFGKYGHDPVLGIDHLGYDGTGNPYTGDTKCKVKLPILCTNVDGSPRPNYDVTAGDEFYEGWVQGHFTTTLPVRGSAILSAADGDNRCAIAFGAGWRMAEFHDGAYVTGMNASNFGHTIGSLSDWPAGPYAYGGWTQFGYGNVRSDMRYWVNINDQPGNCWNP
jgi:hypothetical protein